MSSQREDARSQLKEFVKYGSKFERALDLALGGAVKETIFLPSGRRVYSVVGRLGDEFIDPDRPYCSCSNFFFRVVGGKEDLCYHLLGHKIASKLGMVDVVRFSDEEYGAYLTAAVEDVFDVLGKSGG